MRIMLIGTDRTLFFDGSAVSARVARLAKLKNDQIDCVVFSTKQHGTPSVKEVAPGVRAYATNSESRLGYISDAVRVAKTLERPDVIAVQDPFEVGLAGVAIAKHFKTPLVVEAHTDFLAPAFRRHSLLNRVRVVLAPFVFKKASAVNVVSKLLQEKVKKKYNLTVPIENFPLFVDIARLKNLPRHPKKGSLLWIGRFAKEKDPHTALSAFHQALLAGHDIHLTFLGDGLLQGELQARVKKLGIEDRVSFPGWQDPASYLEYAELLLVTSLYEGYGMVIVEALSAGVPVLSTDVGVAREAGALIAAYNYTMALVSWLNGPRMRGELAFAPYVNEADYDQKIFAFYERSASLT
jgi:glycosyltransferase involved in cell wall biosynthesis